MSRVRLPFFLLSWCLLSVANAETYTPGEKVRKNYKSYAQKFLTNYCVDCHGETEPEGDLSLHNLGPVDEVNAATWRSVWAQVSLPLEA